MTLPPVTVAIPVFNEAADIEACLTSLRLQSYPGPMEILVLDGGSSDATVQRAAHFPGVQVVPNPGRIQAAALNVALEQAGGEILIRVDGHCMLAPDYVSRCVQVLSETGAAMVGGGMTPAGVGGFAAVAAAAMRHPLAVGTARFHRPGAPAGWVDTVYLGAFRVSTGKMVGGYDESMATNEDAEFAWRMRRHGGVWFDPAISSLYQPRSDPVALARQFFRYGRGRVGTILRHPASVSLRQLAAPALLVGLLSPWRVPVAAAYAMVLLYVAATARRLPLRRVAQLPMAVATIHFAWGLGFFAGLPGALRASIRPVGHA